MATGQQEEILCTTPKEDDSIEINIITNEKPNNDSHISEPKQAVEPLNHCLIGDLEINIVKSTPKEIARLFRSLNGLSPFQIRVLEMRYISLLEDYQRRLFYVDIFYHFSRSLVSVGSVAVPALLSIQSPTGQFSQLLFWTTWAVSLSVTICHNFTSIFRFDKKFFGLHSTVERLKSEGWQYLELTGNYSGHHGHTTPSHANQYVYFLNKVERLKLKQVEEEYNTAKEPEKISAKGSASTATATPKEQIPSPLDLTGNRGKKT